MYSSVSQPVTSILRTRHFSAHLGYLFGELPLSNRVAAAAEAGFAAVEHPHPYSISADEMARELSHAGLSFTQIALPAGDTLKGEKGLAILPNRLAEFSDSINRGLDYAEAIGCRMVHVMAGLKPSGIAPRVLWSTYISNLQLAAEAAARRGITILIEPIGAGTLSGYYVDHPAIAARAITDAGLSNIRLLLDIFHCVNSGLDPVAAIRHYGGLLAHVHIADHPGRHEPGTGHIEFPSVYRALDQVGYAGVVGCEYIPITETRSGLGWIAATREANSSLFPSPGDK
ncbi:TIM barrel protein [Phyllobacterium sp. SB3]|uniref:hydroxypyruvate isomerase family protein n=1 Tax=Phyllobacterium sp. SB3 TaxID=3156073 RepID=UPI0032AF2E07